MASKTRPPPTALAPYLRLPPETSLVTLTATLGCGTSAVWIAARYIAEVLAERSEVSETGGNSADGGDGMSVVVASWQHDEKFWKSEIRRTTGLDVTKVGGKERWKFLDFLTSPPPASSSMQELEKKILSVLPSPSHPSSGENKKTILILDNPLLALLTTTPKPPLSTLLLSLRSHPSIHNTLLLLPSPSPFPPTTPWDSSIANFTTSALHASRLVLSCRELETGAARDVSGVLRITRGGDSDWGQGGEEGEAEAELLYLIQRDGVAKVFKRGSGSGGEV